MDRLQQFLELVDCRPDEVRDVPPLQQPPSPETRRLSSGEAQIYFGKYKGKKLKEIPPSYLRWALSQRASSRSFRKFQQQAKLFLAV
jgi:hypothetical protein